MKRITPEDEEAMAHVGGEVARRREKLGFDREVFAAMCGVRVATVIDIEKGRQMPGGGTLMRLAASLKCRVEDLMPPGYQVTFGPLMVPRERPVESGKQTTRRRKAKESGFAAVAQMVAVSASMLAFLALPGVTKAVTPIIHLM